MDQSTTSNPQEQQKPAGPKPAPLDVDPHTQQLVAKNTQDLVRKIRWETRGLALPKSLDTEEKLIAAWNLACSFNVPPARGIANISFINGATAIWGELPKALAHATGEMESFQLIYIDRDQNIICLDNKNLNAEVWAAVCRVRRKNQERNEYFFSIEDAKKARLIGKTGPWTDYTKIMLSRRAVGMAMKFEFPDALMGMKIAEYDFDYAPDLEPARDVTRSSLIDDMEKEFSGGKEEEGKGQGAVE